MKRTPSARMGAALTLIAMCGGGSLFTSCHSIWNNALLQGTEQFVLSLIDPTVILDMLDDENGAEQ